MGYKSKLISPIAKQIAKQINRWSADAVNTQNKIFKRLIKIGNQTAFGSDHDFQNIKTYEDFKKRVPLRDYEGLKPYVDRIKNGEANVLWKKKPKYFAKTSGTTSGVKYIPLTKASIPNHFGTARNAVFNYVAQTGKADFLDGKMIFLSGSPELTETAGIPTGRLSGISNHLVPTWLKSNQLPSYPTNCIEEWEEKLERIIDETLGQDMRMISGIPPWVQMYYERLLERTGKKHIKDIFPNFSLFVYGGVNYEPYRKSLENLVGKKVDSLETYPASEGFIAFQDQQDNKGLLLNTNSGIFFEFVPADEIFNAEPTRLSLAEVKTGVNYAIIINNNAGLWGYNIGDTVEFVSLNPYRIIVSGRIKHFISAFGEHVIGKEVEQALLSVANEEQIKIIEFTVAPQVNPGNGETPFHEWFIEFDGVPKELENFELKVDKALELQNIYYQDLIAGKILQRLKIRPLQKDAFRNYMKTQGKLGGQNKVPRLSNDRKIADLLSKYLLSKS